MFKYSGCYGNIYSLKVPLDKLDELLSKDWITRVQFSRECKLGLGKSRVDIHANEVHDSTNLPYSIQGKNVVIGIFDTGIDFNYPNFSDDNDTGIFYLWDMSDETPQNSPKGFD